MSLNVGPQYYVDKNTSFVLVDSSFPTNSTAVVLLSSITIPGRIVSIKDGLGGLGANKFITVSTTKDVYFANSTFAASFNAPYGYMTCTNQSPTSWTITNTYGFPTQSTPAYTLSLTVPDIQSVSSINKVSYPVVNMNLSTLTFGPGTAPSKVYGSATLTAGTATVTTTYVNTNSLIFVQRTSLNSSTDVGNLVVAKSSGSFTITSYKSDGTTASDTSIVDWILFNPAL
jgi:hypothetical protein